jgi:hypothetical protein
VVVVPALDEGIDSFCISSNYHHIFLVGPQ